MNDIVTRFIWDGNVPLHERQYSGEYPPKKLVTENGIEEEKEPVENIITWVYEDGSFVPSAKIEDDENYSIISDYIGRPTHCYDSTGKIVWESEYDIYGEQRKLKGDKTFIPFRQLGQYEDEETGLYYNRLRYYDANSGNYISQDKLRLYGNNPTMYGYVIDNNVYVDRHGLSPEYYPLDDLGRPTGGIAEVSNDTLGTGTDAGSYDPLGWEGGEHPYHQQRGHLISNNHGGSGTDPRNIVTITDGTNHPGMTKYENAITRHVKNGNTVLVEVKAHYKGDEVVPSHISIYAIDQNGKVIADSNVPNGKRQRTKCCAH